MFSLRQTTRKGMYKNWRMGRVKDVRKVHSNKYELDVEVLEKAYDSNGEEFVAKHMLTLTAGSKRQDLIEHVQMLKPNEPIVFGFYIQSWRQDEGSGGAYTILSLKALERITPDEMEIIASSIWANQQDPFQVFEHKSELEDYLNNAVAREKSF